jgi:NAD(P)H-nitrite reductase large subunit
VFHIRTADRRQRPAPWLENLEGGIDYLRQVVCEDSPGTGAGLEADTQRLVDACECEWNKAVNGKSHDLRVDAVGIRVRSVPFTPDKVLAGLRSVWFLLPAG